MTGLKKLWNKITGGKDGEKKADGAGGGRRAGRRSAMPAGLRRACSGIDARGPWRMPKGPAWVRRACINRRFWFRIRARQPLEVGPVSGRRCPGCKLRLTAADRAKRRSRDAEARKALRGRQGAEAAS